MSGVKNIAQANTKGTKVITNNDLKKVASKPAKKK